MGRSMLELLELKNKGELKPLEGVGVIPTAIPPRDNVLPKPFTNTIKRYLGFQIGTRAEANAYQVREFIKNAPAIYGLDAKRILLQQDPHAAKKAIKKTAGAVAGALGGVVGRVAGAVAEKVTDFNPKYPDDFLSGEDNELKFNLHSNLYRSDYAGGRYYNGGVKNSKTKIGNFFRANKTPKQVGQALLPSAIVLGVSALRGLLTKKKKKKGVTEDVPLAKRRVRFPSNFVVNSTKLYGQKGDMVDDNTRVAVYQNQQSGSTMWPIKFGKDLWSATTGSKRDLLGSLDDKDRDDPLLDLNVLYKNQLFTSDTSSLFGDASYYQPLYLRGLPKNSNQYQLVGSYSKDVLRIFDLGSNPKKWEAFDTIKDFENAEPQWDNLITSESYQIFGAGPKTNSINNKANGKHYNSSVQRFSYDTENSRANFSGSLAGIYKANSAYAQIQNTQISSSTINPYLKTKNEVLNKNTNDLIKVRVGDISLLATLTGLTDTPTPNWQNQTGVGSGFNFYFYDNWEREIAFKVQMYAENKAQLDKIWEKANQIQSFTLPKSKGNLGVFGELISLKIGNIIDEPYGFLSACNMTVLDVSPWEIDVNKQKPFIFELDISYKVVTNKISGYKFYV